MDLNGWTDTIQDLADQFAQYGLVCEGISDVSWEMVEHGSWWDRSSSAKLIVKSESGRRFAVVVSESADVEYSRAGWKVRDLDNDCDVPLFRYMTGFDSIFMCERHIAGDIERHLNG